MQSSVVDGFGKGLSAINMIEFWIRFYRAMRRFEANGETEWLFFEGAFQYEVSTESAVRERVEWGYLAA